jgi:hypothetical protein
MAVWHASKPVDATSRLASVIKCLTVAEIVNLVRETPEQTVFDWKRTFGPPRDDDTKGDFAV